MKCLSVCQPFAHLIVSGRKTVELRGWNTHFRGPFLIHSPARILDDDCRRLRGMQALKRRGLLHTSAIIGRAVLYDVKRYDSEAQLRADGPLHLASSRRYGTSKGTVYGFMLRDARPLRVPVPYRGRLGLFEAAVGTGPAMPGRPHV